MTFSWGELIIQVVLVTGVIYGLSRFLIKWLARQTLSLSSSELEKLRGEIGAAVSNYVTAYVGVNSPLLQLPLYRLNEAFGEILCDEFLT